jgi:predicted RNA binding protein YcfA (HicA-like mRNA interferase family)
LPHHKPVSGDLTIKILCKNFGFSITGRTGSHVRLSKMTDEGKVGTVIPVHDELKPGTLKGILKLAKIDLDDFYRVV